MQNKCAAALKSDRPDFTLKTAGFSPAVYLYLIIMH